MIVCNNCKKPITSTSSVRSLAEATFRFASSCDPDPFRKHLGHICDECLKDLVERLNRTFVEWRAVRGVPSVSIKEIDSTEFEVLSTQNLGTPIIIEAGMNARFELHIHQGG